MRIAEHRDNAWGSVQQRHTTTLQAYTGASLLPVLALPLINGRRGCTVKVLSCRCCCCDEDGRCRCRGGGCRGGRCIPLCPGSV